MFSQSTITPTVAHRIGFAVLATMFAVAASIAIMGRGPWYDEFYSLYVTRPGVPLSALYPAWLRDNHPPLFYALAWGWSRLITGVGLPVTIEAMRVINLAILAVVAWILVRIARADAWFARIAWYDCIALASTFPAMDQIAQLRSYFLSFGLAAIVLPLLAQQIIARQIIDRGCRRAMPILGLALAVAFSVHVLTTAIIGSLVAATVLHHALARRWRDACRLAMVAALALVPFVITMAIQFSTIATNTRTFWIPGGFNAGRWAIETEVHDAILANPLLVLVALGGLVAILSGLRRGDPDARATAAVITTFSAGLVLAIIVLMAAHLYRPMLVSRYLVALDPVIAMILALGAHAAMRRLTNRTVIAIDATLLLATGLALTGNALGTMAKPSWDGTARDIAAVVHTCPQATVHPGLRWNTLALDMLPRDNRAVVPFAYRIEATRYRFAISDSGSLSTICPNVFWTEHVAGQFPPAQTIVDALRRSGTPIRSGRMKRVGIGWILITPPLR